MIYSLIWDDFCSWYLEWIKPGFEEDMDSEIYAKTVSFFESVLQLLHPFMPFVSEEIYHLLREKEDDLCVKQFKGLTEADDAVLQQGILLQNLITGIRDAKNKNGLKPREPITISIQTNDTGSYQGFASILAKQTSAEAIHYVDEPVADAIIIASATDRIYVQAKGAINIEGLKTEIEKDLDYQRNFLNSVSKKLSNDRFVQNAKPEVVALERKKQSDAEARIKSLEESLANL